MELYTSNDNSLWKTSLAAYKEVVSLVEQERQKKSTLKKGEAEKLTTLDKWYQDVLPGTVSARKPPHLKHEELCRLMKWKLKRGKFRPRLTELVQQNSPSSVESITERAFAQMPNLKVAVQTLSQLKAVGPATASAILCLAFPNKVPFMADESVRAVPELSSTKLDYSLTQYMTYAKNLQGRAKELNHNSGSSSTKPKLWTAHNVELALWSFHFAKRLKPELVEPTAHCSQESSEDDSSAPPPTKKKKS